jgi:hypothetical protein
MATIAQERMGYATEHVQPDAQHRRQRGIAITATILQRQRVKIGSQMGEHVSAYDPTTQTLLAQITNGLVAAGLRPRHGHQRAYVILNGMLFRQASMVSFVMLFRLLGVIFLLMIPLVFIMRRPKAGRGAGHGGVAVARTSWCSLRRRPAGRAAARGRHPFEVCRPTWTNGSTRARTPSTYVRRLAAARPPASPRRTPAAPSSARTPRWS